MVNESGAIGVTKRISGYTSYDAIKGYPSSKPSGIEGNPFKYWGYISGDYNYNFSNGNNTAGNPDNPGTYTCYETNEKGYTDKISYGDKLRLIG